jgi:hypothetical protein
VRSSSRPCRPVDQPGAGLLYSVTPSCPTNPKRATVRRGAETTGGAGSGGEEALEVAYPDREEATREAEATEEDLARQVTTARLRPFSCRLAASRAGQASGRALDPPWALQIRPHPRPSRRPSLSQIAGNATCAGPAVIPFPRKRTSQMDHRRSAQTRMATGLEPLEMGNGPFSRPHRWSRLPLPAPLPPEARITRFGVS